MKLAKIISLLVLAFLVGVVFTLTPATAGEHPWQEDEYGGNGDTTVVYEEGDTNDVVDPEGECGADMNFGSPYFWWQLLTNSVTGSLSKTSTCPVADPVSSGGSNRQIR